MHLFGCFADVILKITSILVIVRMDFGNPNLIHIEDNVVLNSRVAILSKKGEIINDKDNI